MTDTEKVDAESTPGLQQVPVAWEALEDAFENNAPEVHSFLNTLTGDVVRVVDGVADPAVAARMASDSTYMRVDPVSSREQYRWMERYIATLDASDLHTDLMQAIDGKGAFRRFKDVLMTYPEARERWFTFRSERLRSAMDAWLETHGIEGVVRDLRDPSPTTTTTAADLASVGKAAKPTRADTSAEKPSPRLRTPRGIAVRGAIELRSDESTQRRRAQLLIANLPQTQLESAIAFLEFLVDRGSSLASPAAQELVSSETVGQETVGQETVGPETVGPETVGEDVAPEDTDDSTTP